jgi:hypothetical protein
MKKYLFGLGAMLVGAGLMFVLMHGEVSAEDTIDETECKMVLLKEGPKQKEFRVVSYCNIKDLTCVLNGGSTSCVRGSMF